MRAVAVLLGVGLLVAGCGADEGSGPPWHDGVEPAAAAGTVGGSDSPCRLPVTLSIAEDWKPHGVPDDVDQIGGARLACEVDAKPANHLGFVRVYVAVGPLQPRPLLEQFLAHDKRTEQARYRDIDHGVELTYVSTSTEGDKTRRRDAALSAGGRTVVISLDALDDEEYLDMLPAYLLATHSVKAGAPSGAIGTEPTANKLPPGPGKPTADAVSDETIRVIGAGDSAAIKAVTCESFVPKVIGLLEYLAEVHATAKLESVHPGPQGEVDYWITANYKDGDTAHHQWLTLTAQQRSDGTWCAAKLHDDYVTTG